MGSRARLLDRDARVLEPKSMGEDVRPVAAEAAAFLRTVVGAIGAGELAADDVQRAYLAGAAGALESVARGSGSPVALRETVL